MMALPGAWVSCSRRLLDKRLVATITCKADTKAIEFGGLGVKNMYVKFLIFDSSAIEVELHGV